MEPIKSVALKDERGCDHMSSLKQAIETLHTHIPTPQEGLGDEAFHMVSRLTPLVNVDLLIKNENRDILLTWRADEFYGPGWHIPGGILRFKETFETRIQAVAQLELRTTVKHDNTPCMIQQTINPTRDTRGHFISLLFDCELSSPLSESHKFTLDNPMNDQWAWHSVIPDNFIEVQREIYGAIFNAEATTT